MALSANQQKDARERILLAVFGAGGTVTVNKTQVDDVSAAATTWLESNAASFLAAMSAPGLASAGQPPAVLAAILAAVATSRYVVPA